jgi:hypothetical protein
MMTYNRLQLSVTATAIHKHVKLACCILIVSLLYIALETSCCKIVLFQEAYGVRTYKKRPEIRTPNIGSQDYEKYVKTSNS